MNHFIWLVFNCTCLHLFTEILFFIFRLKQSSEQEELGEQGQENAIGCIQSVPIEMKC